MRNTAIRGTYSPVNTDKYAGNIKRITYRSMWERRFMLYCDRSSQIEKWSSEEIHIPYLSPKDDKWHNYYPDFWIRSYDDRQMIVEIKPHYQTSWPVNKAKWAAARELCKANDYEFHVLTEKELF